MNVEVNVTDALADLAAIDQAMPTQAQQIIARAAATFERAAKPSTPVGKKPKRAGQRLSTGWQRRDSANPLQPSIAVVNIRPHAHLAAEGWNHIGGRRIAPFVPWIGDAIRVRGQMVDELEGLVQGGLPVTLRALEVTR